MQPLILRSEYLPPDLDDAGKGNTRKQDQEVQRAQKGTKAIPTKATNSSDVGEDSSDDPSESLESDTANHASENSVEEPSPTEDELELQSTSELEFASKKKASSTRRPSKKALQMALDEVSLMFYLPSESLLTDKSDQSLWKNLSLKQRQGIWDILQPK